MKIFTDKKIESLFDDIMTLHLIASESNKCLMTGERPEVADLIKSLKIITERAASAVYTLKGMFGIMLSNEILKRYNELRLKELLKEKER